MTGVDYKKVLDQSNDFLSKATLFFLLVIPLLVCFWFMDIWPLSLLALFIYGGLIASLSILPVIVCKYSYNSYFVRNFTLSIIEILILLVAINPIMETPIIYILMPLVSIVYYDRKETRKLVIVSYVGLILVSIFRFVGYPSLSGMEISAFAMDTIRLSIDYFMVFALLDIICARYDKVAQDVNDSLVQEIVALNEEYMNKSKSNLLDDAREAETYEVEPLFGIVRNSLSGIVKGKDKTVSVELDADLPLSLAGDANRIKDFLVNICSDLLLYHTKAIVDMNVSFDKGLRPKRGGNLYLVITIKSDADFLKNEGDKKALGYFMSRKIVDELKGDFKEYKEENYSVYEIRLLQKVVDEITIGTKRKNQQESLEKAASFSKQYVANHKYYDNRRVLVVDDNKEARKLIDAILSPLGIVTESAESGAMALDTLKSSIEEYDMVLIDYMMPDKSGVETIKELRNLVDEYFKRIPIVLMAINNSDELKKEYKNVGFTDSISKPLSQTELISCIHKVLKEDFPITYEEYLKMNQN